MIVVGGEMNLKKRSLIFVTFFLSCLAIALLGASLGTKVGKLLLMLIVWVMLSFLILVVVVVLVPKLC